VTWKDGGREIGKGKKQQKKDSKWSEVGEKARDEANASVVGQMRGGKRWAGEAHYLWEQIIALDRRREKDAGS